MKTVYVKNIWDMLNHIRHHRQRLYTLGMETKVPHHLKKIVFGLHDIEKFLFLPWLWKYYGKKGDKVKAKKLYTRMNKCGYFIINAVLFFTTYSKEEIKKVKRFEKIIDVIDRHCDPIALEEFDLERTRPLVNFLSVHDLPCAITFKKRWLEKFDSQNILLKE